MDNYRRLNKQQIESMLSDLGNLLAHNDLRANLYVYGGAVMCVEYQFRYSTYDVDCIFTDENVRAYAEAVGNKYGMHKSWLNDAILEIVTDDMKKQTFSKEIRLGGLNVMFPSERQMLAMKLFAARMENSSDFADSLHLAKSMGVRNYGELRGVLEEYFKKDSIRQRNKENKNIITRFMHELAGRL